MYHLILKNIDFLKLFSFITLKSRVHFYSFCFFIILLFFSILHLLSNILISIFQHVRNLILLELNFIQFIWLTIYISLFRHPFLQYLIEIMLSFFTKLFSQLHAIISFFSFQIIQFYGFFKVFIFNSERQTTYFIFILQICLLNQPMQSIDLLII